MKILDTLPISQVDTITYVGTESVRLKKCEIIVWVSVTTEAAVELTPGTRPFPAIIDTGHTHNFAIQNQHLARWAGLQVEALRMRGHVRHGGVRLPLHGAKIWLHRNRPGDLAPSSDPPLPLLAFNGIAVYPDNGNYPRLPLFGLRAIVSNHLHLIIDGEHTAVTLRTRDWRTRLFSWLA